MPNTKFLLRLFLKRRVILLLYRMEFSKFHVATTVDDGISSRVLAALIAIQNL